MPYEADFLDAEQALEDALSDLADNQFDYTAEYEWVENEGYTALSNLRQGGGTLGEADATIKLIRDEIANQQAAAKMEAV